MIRSLQRYFNTSLFFSYSLKERLVLYVVASAVIGLVAFCVILFQSTSLFARVLIGFFYWLCFGSGIVVLSELRIFWLKRNGVKKFHFKVGELWVLTFFIFVFGFVILSIAEILLIDRLPVDLSYYADPANGFLPFSLEFFLKMVPIWIIDVVLVSHLFLRKVRVAPDWQTVSLNTELITIQTDKQSYKLNPKHISHISVVQHYATIFLCTSEGKEEIEVRSSLKKLMEQLPEDLFIQTHRSHIINLAFIENLVNSVDGTRVRLKQTDDTLPVSRRQLASVKQAHKEFEEVRYCQNTITTNSIGN